MNKIIRKIYEFLKLPLAVFCISIILFRGVFCVGYVPSQSMEDTVMTGSSFTAIRLYGKRNNLQRGDIIVFQTTAKQDSQSKDNPRCFLKRIVGVGGDIVEIKNGKTYINGNYYDETNWLKEEPNTNLNFGPFVVPDGSYFVMGDNRTISNDARSWTYKDVTSDEIVARAWFKYYPHWEVF